MDRSPAVGTVVIHIDKTDTKHNGSTGSRMARTVDDKHQSYAECPIVRRHQTAVFLSGMLNKAREEQAAARNQARVSREHRAQIERERTGLDRERETLSFRNRPVRRCTAVSSGLGLAGMLTGMFVGGVLGSEVVIASSFALGICAIGPFAINSDRMKAAERDIANRRAILDRQAEALPQRETQTQRERERTDRAVKEFEQALIEPMRAFVTDLLTHCTPIEIGPTGIVADYVGINDDALQN